MIIVSDFNNTLEIDGKIDPELFQYLRAMAEAGHTVAIFSGNPDQAAEYIGKAASGPNCPSKLIHVENKLDLQKWLKGLNVRKADIGFDDDIAASPINPMFCKVFIDRHSEDYDSFMQQVAVHGPEAATFARINPQTPFEQLTPAF